AQAAVEFRVELGRTVDDFEHVHTFTVARDLVGQPAPAPLFGAGDGAAEALDDGQHLLVQFGECLVGRIRRRDDDQFVLTDGAHMPPYGHQPAFTREAARSLRGYGRSLGRLNVFITAAVPLLIHSSTASADRAIASSIPASSSGANPASTCAANSRRSSPRPTPIRSRAYCVVASPCATDFNPLCPPSEPPARARRRPIGRCTSSQTMSTSSTAMR